VKSFTKDLQHPWPMLMFFSILFFAASATTTMKIKNQLLMAAALLGATQLASAADITGKVTLKGIPPPEKELPLDQSCGALHKGEKVTTRFYVVGPDSGLAEVFVYLKSGLESKTFEPPAQPAVLDQKGCEYIPYVFGLRVNQKLLVSISDPFLHNVHVLPDPSSGNKESNKAQMAGMKPFEFTFEHPEVFLKFKCEVHPWMFAYAGLVDHPFYAVTAKDGTFTIKNVPPGSYKVEALHRKTHGTADRGIVKDVTVGAGGAKVDFVVEVPQAK